MIPTPTPSVSAPVPRRQKTIESILATAEMIISNEGEASLSIRRIAEEIEYSPAAVYKYFRTKAELINALKEAFFLRILAKIDQLATEEAPYSVRARRCISVYIQTALEKPHHYSAAFSGIDDTVSRMTEDDFVQTNKGKAFDYLQALVAEGVGSGELRADLDPTLAAKSLWASCHGLAVLSLHLPGYPDVLTKNEGSDDASGQMLSSGEFISYHADLIMRGLEADDVTKPVRKAGGCDV